MRLKTFTAATMTEAMGLVRADMGDDAIIVSTKKGGDGDACRITAAVEDPFEADRSALDALVEDDGRDANARDAYLRQVLTAHGLPPHLLEPFMRAAEAVDGDDPALALAAAIDARMRFRPFDFESAGRPIVLVGTPGAGKTITAAKIAATARFKGRRIAVATTDAKRAGGIEQLAAFTRILEVELIAASAVRDLAERAPDIAAAERAVIDTGGVNPFDDAAMMALADTSAAVGGEMVLVLPAGGDAMESADTARAFADIGAERMIVTRLDMTRRLGGILAAALVGRLPIAHVSINPQVADGLNRINPVSLARLVVPDDDAETAPRRTKVAT